MQRIKKRKTMNADFESKTVTLANPSGTVFDLDMELFEERYAQVGSYAVLIK